MSHILVLISNPAAPALTLEVLAGVAAKCKITSAPKWLKSGVAAEFDIEGQEPRTMEDMVRTVLSGQAIDIAVVERTTRKKAILIADMDSTMIEQECIDELAAELGIKEQIATITAQAMRGELDFEAALTSRVALLKGLPESVIQKVLDTRISYMPGGQTLVSTMKKHGAYCALVSGGFTPFTSAVAAKLGFDENRANTLLIENGNLSGKVGMPILGREAKVQALEEIAKKLKLSVENAIAVGDGANDLGMINRAGLGVALHAKPAVAAEADVRIDHGDLTALLYLQGYSEAEFAE